MRRENQKKVPLPSMMEIEAATSQNCDPVAMPNPIQAWTADAIQEPFEGMEFESEELAKTFYINYAKCMGFRARISRYGLSRHDNSIISRHIVCSKEGKSNVNSEGKAKRPRFNSRVGCPAMIVVRLVNSGKWIITKFEREHNHGLSPRSKEKNGISEEYKKVLYNKLHEEAMKFVAEGSVTEEIYNVAIAALKEASDKVSLAKKNAAEKEVSSDSSSSDHSSTETMSIPAASSGGSHKAVTTPIKAIPISSRPAKPGSSPADAQSNGGPVQTPGKIPQPTSLIHATAIACGARVVPPNQAISIVKAIEAKIMSGKAIVAKAPVLHNCKPLSGETTREVHGSNESGEHD
jgi:predicted house-cleaning noncanonical NTP pyrophosphatase (MazG superfamily)